MPTDQSEEGKLIERLRKTTSSKWWIPNVVGVAAVCLGVGSFAAWMAERGRATIENPIVWRAVLQARVEYIAWTFGLLSGVAIGAILAVYYSRKQQRLLVSMWDRLESLEKAAE